MNSFEFPDRAERHRTFSLCPPLQTYRNFSFGTILGHKPTPMTTPPINTSTLFPEPPIRYRKPKRAKEI